MQHQLSHARRVSTPSFVFLELSSCLNNTLSCVRLVHLINSTRKVFDQKLNHFTPSFTKIGSTAGLTMVSKIAGRHPRLSQGLCQGILPRAPKLMFGLDRSAPRTSKFSLKTISRGKLKHQQKTLCFDNENLRLAPSFHTAGQI